MHFKRLLSVPCKNMLHCLIFYTTYHNVYSCTILRDHGTYAKGRVHFCLDLFSLVESMVNYSKGLTFNHCLDQSGTGSEQIFHFHEQG